MNEPPPIPKYPLGDDTPETPSPLDRMKAGYKSISGKLGVLSVAENLLRQPASILYEAKNGRFLRLITLQVVLISVCLLVYGFTVGLFALEDQLWQAPTKIVTGLLFAGLICLPSLFIFICLSGAEVSLRETVALMVAMLSIMALLLLGFGPVSFVFSRSTESISFMGSLQLIFWFISVYYGFQFLHRAFLLLNGNKNGHLAVWSFIFLIVALQMSTTLRPIIGRSDTFFQTEKKFFISHWLETLEENVKLTDYVEEAKLR